LLAAEHGQAGRRYLLAGENRTFAEFFSDLAVAAGQRPRAIPCAPAWALQALAELSELLSRFTQKEPYPSFQHVQLNRLHWYCRSDRAGRELGYRWRPLAESLADAFCWHTGHSRLRMRSINRWWMRPERHPSIASSPIALPGRDVLRRPQRAAVRREGKGEMMNAE